jgi:zinc protease
MSFPAVRLPRRQTRALRRVVTRDKEQASILLGHLGIARSSPDYFKIRVLDTILGDSPGFTSRIPRVLRDERGLAYSVQCDMARSAGLDPGRFVAYIGTAPESVSDAIEGLREQIRLITTEPPSESEVEAAKAYLTGSFVFEFESNALVASYLAKAELFSLGDDYPRRFLAEIGSVTPGDVFEVGQKYLNPDAMTEVIVGPVRDEG